MRSCSQLVRATQDADKLIDAIRIPASLITRELGSRIKAWLLAGSADGGDAPPVVAEMDWSETIPDPTATVTWSLWGTSSTACGSVCHRLVAFLHSFSSDLAALNAANATTFAPHFASWRCEDGAAECATQCINHGRCVCCAAMRSLLRASLLTRNAVSPSLQLLRGGPVRRGALARPRRGGDEPAARVRAPRRARARLARHLVEVRRRLCGRVHHGCRQLQP
jgi:hypothetical protein